MISKRLVLPGVRFAVEAYLHLVAERSLLEAVASSLTEMFSRDLIAFRVPRLKQFYPWIAGGLEYFEARLTQAPEDADFALDFVYRHAVSREAQELCVRALETPPQFDRIRVRPAFRDIVERARAGQSAAARMFADADGHRLLGVASP